MLTRPAVARVRVRMRERACRYLESHNVRTDGSDHDLALRVIHASGVDVRTMIGQSPAYVMEFAIARLDDLCLDSDQPRDEKGRFGEGGSGGASAQLGDRQNFNQDSRRLDEWNPDQPRDEQGKFAGSGSGTTAGAVKSGVSAAGKAESASDLGKIAASLEKSTVISAPADKAAIYNSLAQKAFELEEDDLAESYEEKAGALGGGGEANPPANLSKDAAHTAHAKEAREAAKAITAHAKQLRDQYKKNPTPENKAKVEAAEKAAKAARSAARKAEKAKDATAAAKHAEKAKAHLSKTVGGDEETAALKVTKAAEVKAPAATPAKAPTIAKTATAALQKQADKLKAAADQKHPESWSAEKIAAKEAAQKTLAEHANPTTPDELKAAADALDKVAAQASAAGSAWGSGYKSLAAEMREAATPRETFSVGKGGTGDHGVAPEKSTRPVADIKGEIVSEKTFKEHREAYTATLNTDEKAAALKYSGQAYGQINSNLRKGGEPDKTVRDLDKAIAKAPAPRDMIVHRGVGGEKSLQIYSGMKEGDQFVEKAYSSTSAGGSAAFGGQVEKVITVPKGYPVAPIPSQSPGEREYLLRRNTKFQVTKIEHVESPNGAKKVRVHVTVIHDGEDK